MNAITRQKINDLADAIREACNVNIPASEQDLKDLIKRLGGECKVVSDLDYEAKIEKTSPTSFCITLSEDFMPRRRKFSIAHELGHLFLHMGFLVAPQVWQNTPPFQDSARFRLGRSEEEFEANEFAAALLMPKDEFERIAEDNCNGDEYDLGGIARHFEVSLEAAQTRGRFLGLFGWK